MVFFGRLRDKCVILATHDEQAIQRATKIIYLEPGELEDNVSNTKDGSGEDEPEDLKPFKRRPPTVRVFTSYIEYREACPTGTRSAYASKDEQYERR